MSFPGTFKNNHLLSTSIVPGAQLKHFMYLVHWTLLSTPHDGHYYYLSFPLGKNWGTEKLDHLSQDPINKNWWSQGVIWAVLLFLILL